MSEEFEVKKMAFRLQSGNHFERVLGKNGKGKLAKFTTGDTVISDVDLEAKFKNKFVRIHGDITEGSEPTIVGESTKEKAAKTKKSSKIQKGSIEADDVTSEDKEKATTEEAPKRRRTKAAAPKNKDDKKPTVIDQGGDFYAKERAGYGKGKWDLFNRKTKKKLNAKDKPLTENEALDIVASGELPEEED